MDINVDLKEKSYIVTVERGALKRAGEIFDLNRKVLVVSDDGVPSEYAYEICSQAKEACVAVLQQGEKSKNIDNFQKLLSLMLENGFSRKDCVVAVGGGVVGDLAGFAAACYMRGVDFYNVPTTLLSQVDSSIGGKTAIDFCGVKNVVGAFYQPKAVICDADVLCTLDDRQFAAGLAEIIKMALTSDESLFEEIENCDDIKANIDVIEQKAIAIKRDVVEQDPNEKGLRKVLNFGHTVGHAIESVEQGKLLHGECVALGMLPMCDQKVRARLEAVLAKFGLPTEFKWGAGELLPYIKHDKKAESDCVSVVLVNKIGSFEFEKETADEISERVEKTK